jgi:chromosome segregation ATPase
MLFKRVLGLLTLAFGFLGVVSCVAGVYAVWSLGSRLERANDKLFAMIDKGLAVSQDRIREVETRIKESKITTDEFGQRLRDWSTSRAKEGLVSRLEIESRAEKLVGRLQTAESWLETSTESIRSVQRVMELCNSIGVPMDPASLEEVLENITSLRSRLQQTERTVDGIRAITADKEGESEETRLSRVTTLLGRILVTIGDMDTRLEESVTRLSELQTDARQLKATTSAYILVATVGCYVLLAWIGAGQAALCRWGWTKCRPSRSAA